MSDLLPSQRSSVRRMLLAAVPFLLLVVLVDRGLGLGLEALFRRVSTGTETGGLARTALEHTNVDIVVFGTSRARHHIDPAVLRERLGRSAWNAGCDAQTIDYHLMLEALVLQRGTTAKVFVITPEASEFGVHNSRAILLAPFYGQSADADQVLLRMSRFERLKLLSHTYRYNSRVLHFVRNLASPEGNLDRDGYVPLEGTVPDAIRGVPEVVPPVDFDTLANKIQAADDYRSFIRRAKARHVEVFMTIGPRYWPAGSVRDEWRERVIALLAQIADEEGAVLERLDEITNPELNDPELFRDRVHLNARGAARWSRLLADRLAERYPELAR